MTEPPGELHGSIMAAVKKEKRRRRVLPGAAAGVLAASLAVVIGLRCLPFRSAESAEAPSGTYMMSAGSDAESGVVYSIETPVAVADAPEEPETADGATAEDSLSAPQATLGEDGSNKLGLTQDTERGLGGTATPLVCNGSLAIEPSSVKELRFEEKAGGEKPAETLVFAGDAEEETEYFVSLVLVPVDGDGAQDGAVTVTYAPAVTGTIDTSGWTETTKETEPSGETGAVVSSIESADGVTFTTVTVVFTDDSTVSFKYSADGYIVADDVWYTFVKPEERR